MNTKAIVLAVGLALAPAWASATITNVPNPTSPVSYGSGVLTFTPSPVENFWYSANEPANQGDATVEDWIEGITGELVDQMFKCSGGSCTPGGNKGGGDGKSSPVTISSTAPFDYIYLHSGQGQNSVYSWLFEFAQPVYSFTFSGLPKGFSNAVAFDAEDDEQVPEPAPLVIMAAPLALLFRKMWS